MSGNFCLDTYLNSVLQKTGMRRRQSLDSTRFSLYLCDDTKNWIKLMSNWKRVPLEMHSRGEPCSGYCVHLERQSGSLIMPSSSNSQVYFRLQSFFVWINNECLHLWNAVWSFHICTYCVMIKSGFLASWTIYFLFSSSWFELFYPWLLVIVTCHAFDARTKSSQVYVAPSPPLTSLSLSPF